MDNQMETQFSELFEFERELHDEDLCDRCEEPFGESGMYETDCGEFCVDCYADYCDHMYEQLVDYWG